MNQIKKLNLKALIYCTVHSVQYARASFRLLYCTTTNKFTTDHIIILTSYPEGMSLTINNRIVLPAYSVHRYRYSTVRQSLMLYCVRTLQSGTCTYSTVCILYIQGLLRSPWYVHHTVDLQYTVLYCTVALFRLFLNYNGPDRSSWSGLVWSLKLYRGRDY